MRAGESLSQDVSGKSLPEKLRASWEPVNLSACAAEVGGPGAELAGLPRGGGGDGEGGEPEEGAAVGPEADGEAAGVVEGVPDQQGDEGSADVDVPAYAAEPCPAEGADERPGESEGEGDGEQRH